MFECGNAPIPIVAAEAAYTGDWNPSGSAEVLDGSCSAAQPAGEFILGYVAFGHVFLRVFGFRLIT
jgi:hypothetical protein